MPKRRSWIVFWWSWDMPNKTFRELADVLYGKSPNDIRVHESPFPIWGTGGKIGSAKKPLFSGPIIILPRKGTLTNPSYCETDCWVIDTAYGAIAHFDVDTKWLFYNLSQTNLESLNEATGVPSINRDLLYRLEFYTPEPDIQRKIAKILTTVDNLIEQIEAAITKYQAIKQGMMHDLFTQGVDANGRLRPPREEAPELYKESELGWIPKEWEIKKADEICFAVIDCKNRTPPETESGYPVIKTTNIKNGKLLLSSATFTDESSYKLWTAKGIPSPGDILITREAPIGETCVVPDTYPICLGQRMMMYKPDPNKIISNFLLYSIISHRIQARLIELAGGSTVGHVRVCDIRSLSLPIAPTQEQGLISSLLATADSHLTKQQEFALKLYQIKSGLMQDLLSGRVRVPTTDTATDQEPRHAS
jgi:type I restriction enzyme S subunit